MDPVTLSILINAIDNASTTIKDVETHTASLGEAAKAASEKTGLLGQAFDGLLKGVAVGAGITVATNALNSLGEAIPHAIEEVTTFGQEVLKMQRQTGASAETSSALLAAFERFGVSSEQASKSLGIFSRGLVTVADMGAKAESSSNKVATAVRDLGLNIKDSSGALIPMSEQILNVADKFAGMADGIDKNNDAMALFGRSGLGMILLLNQGRDGLQEAMDAAQKYGLVLSGDTVQQVREFGLAHKDLDEAMKGVTLQVGVALLPVLAKLAEGAAGLAQGFNQTVLPALKEFGAAIDTFTASDAFQMWSARLLVVIGLIGEGVGALAGVFFTALGGILDVVNTVGQAIYQGLQWLNPFATHSPPLVSQVQDGVAAIQASYESLGGLTATFDGIGASFENLGAKTADFASTVDDVSTKTEKALAVMGPDVTDAFNAASDAMQAAKGSLADIKSAWDDAAAALVPLKDNLDATKDALKDQQDVLSGLKGQLSDAKAAFDPLNEALKDATQGAKDADAAIKNLTSAPIQGSAEFTKKISDANIALKTQALELSNIKQSSGYQSLGDQIDAATVKLKEMQRAQAAAPLAVAGTSPAARAAATEAANAARAAIQEQSALLDSLKGKQADLLTPAQKKLDIDRNALDTINLQRDATIGVAQEQIRQAAAVASGVREQTQAQIEAGLAAAGAAKVTATTQVDTLTPQVAAQQAVMDGLTARIKDQEQAVADAKTTSDAANQTYLDAKKKVDDLGAAYRDTKTEIANYDQQLKATIATGDMQVQKIAAAAAATKAAAAAAKSAAAAAAKVVTPPTGGDTGPNDLLANIDEAKKKAEDFGKAIDQAKQDVSDFFKPVSDAADALKTFLAPLGDLGHWLTVAAVAFGVFAVSAGPVGAILGIIGSALALLLTPIGLAVVAVAALGLALSTNFGGIRTILQPALDMFVALQDRLKDLAAVLTTAFQTGGFEGLVTAIGQMLPGILNELGTFTVELEKWALDVGDQLVAAVLTWGSAFLDWIEPLAPQVITALTTLLLKIEAWILTVADELVTHLLAWSAAFVNWLLPQIPGILAMLATVALKIIDWISAAGSMLAEHLGKWAAQFIAWIIPLLPKLGVALEQIAGATIDFIFAAVPKVLGALAGWAGAFLGWVLPTIPGLLVALWALVVELATWLETVGLPKIVAGLFAWGKAFVEWVTPLIPPLLVEAAKIFDALAGWILATAKDLGTNLLVWTAAFIAWIIPLIPPFLVEVGKIKDALWGWITERAKDLGEKIVNEWGPAFLSWIAQVIADLPANISKILDAIGTWITGKAVPWAKENLPPFGAAILAAIGVALSAVDTAFQNLLDAIWKWVTETALPWIKTNLSQLGTGIINAIGDGFNALGSLLQGLWNSVEADLGAGIHYSGTKGLTWTGPALSIPLPTIGGGPGGASASPGVRPADALGTAPPGATPGGSTDLTNPERGQRGEAALSVTTVPTGGTASAARPSQFADLAMSYDEASAICGPAAAIAFANVNGMYPTLAQATAIASKTGWTQSAGMGGVDNEMKLLDNMGLTGTLVKAPTREQISAATGSGSGAILSTPGHYFTASGSDTNALDVGTSGSDLRGAHGATTLSVDQIQALEGPITALIQDIHSTAMPAAETASAAVDATPGGGVDLTNPGGQRGDPIGPSINAAILDAKNYADRLGISIDAANKILLDNGKVAQSVFGKQLPAATDLSDQAIEQFAAGVGVNWTEARVALSAGGALADAVMGTQIPTAAQTSVDSVAGVGTAISTGLGGAILDAKVFADKTGISIDAANKILMDHGTVAKSVLATAIPGDYAITNDATQKFAAAFGLSFAEAKRVLEMGGDVSAAVMGTQIPAAAQTSINAVGDLGKNPLWAPIVSNAAIAGKGLVEYLQMKGSPAIDVATASLEDLEKASGLTMPQIQAQVKLAGGDIDTWLRQTGVPAAQGLAGALGMKDTDGTPGVAGAADLIKKPVDDAKAAITPMGAAMDVAASTQIAAVMLDLRDGLLGLNKHSDGVGLIQAVKDFTDALSKIHNVDVTVTTHYKSDGTPSSAGSASGSGGSAGGGSSGGSGDGSSGPGGSRNDPSTGHPYVVNNPPSNTGGGGQLINDATPGAGRTNPNQFALGGLVPGPIGAALAAIVHGGELVLTPDQQKAQGLTNPGATKTIATAMSSLPSTQNLNQMSAVMDHLRDTFHALPKEIQIKAHIQADSASPAAAMRQTYVPRTAAAGTGSSGSGSKISRQDAQMIAEELSKAMQNAPAPRVAVDDIKSALIRGGQRNGGVVGLA